jgi:hypothetical protein
LPQFRLALAGLAALALATLPGVAQAVPRDVGILTCLLANSEDAAQPQMQDMLCAFRPSDRPEEIYLGTAHLLAADQQPRRIRVMIWIVKGPPDVSDSAGLLQQTYAAEPNAFGGHAPTLVGDTDASIVLQPLADSPPLSGADKRRSAAELIVVVALRLKSTAG